jgi:signal transduction histidine kinase
MNEKERRQRRKGAVKTFLLFFIANAFVITASFFLFFDWMGVRPERYLSAAIVTFGNVLFVTLIELLVYHINSHFTMTKPVRKIQRGLEQITGGDFSVRIEPTKSDAFDAIADSINRMTAELQSIETLKTDFVSNVSHEIKTPIAVIQNYSRLLENDGVTDEERSEYIQAISAASQRLNGLITNILRLNRLENQKINPKTEQFDLSAQLTECLLGFEAVWEEKNIEIEPDIEDDVFINADRELLSIVWNNLLSNAFKFTESGGTVGVTLKTEKAAAVVSIRDTGCGMTEETVRHIFDKFYQGDTSHATQGNGLGLALVKRIINMTGGEIVVTSKMGEGSTFTVKLNQK